MQHHIAIATGGTAGHVAPALAVAEVLRAKGAAITFIGTAERLEAELVPKAGFEIEFLKVRGLDRRNPFRAASALGLALAATLRARKLLRRLGVDAVVGGGGYVAGPVGLAAASLRLPLIITEADSHLGVTNRLLARFARRVCLSFPLEGRSGSKYLVTGRPIRSGIGTMAKPKAKQHFDIERSTPTLAVVGGSLGARSINQATLKAFSSGLEVSGQTVHVLHICGRRDYSELSTEIKLLKPPNYTLIGYLENDDYLTLLSAADLIVARAGGSIFELAAVGCPAILVPYPYAAAGHQAGNARWMVEHEAAILIEDSELDGERLKSVVEELLSDRSRLSLMSAAAKRVARPDAAEAVAREVLEALDG